MEDSTSVLFLARRLGEALSNSKDLMEFQQAEADLLNNHVSWNLWQDYLSLLGSVGPVGGNNEKRVKLEMLKAKAEEDNIINRYLEAKQNLSNLVEGINFILRRSVGQEQGGCDRGCGVVKGRGCH